jgi:2-polyprenyl-3-methyl-5-hydroxy-6-metoxy-1,4-benzoquinol methylase
MLSRATENAPQRTQAKRLDGMSPCGMQLKATGGLVKSKEHGKMEQRVQINKMRVDVLDKCPACAGKRFKPLPIPRVRIGEDYFGPLTPDLGLNKCRDCGLTYVSPRPNPSFLLGFYERPAYNYHNADHGKADHCGRLELLGRIGAGQRLLDVGCGGGSFMASAQEAGYAVTGIEPSSQGRNAARQAGLDVHADAASLIKQQRRFDVITVWHVIEHVPDVSSILREIKALLDEKGIVVVAVPNALSARAILFRMFPRLCPPDDDAYRAFPIHLYAFSRRSLAKMIQSCGLSVVSSTTQYLALNEIIRPAPRENSSAPHNRKPADASTQTTGPSATRNRPKSFLKRMLLTPARKAFFAFHLGESLVMVARQEKDR